jgi:hypothetical protein
MTTTTTTEETSAIDEKKEDSDSKMDYKGFITNYLSSILFSIGLSVFIIGTVGLYTTKIAQANILPDNIELAPYTVIDRVVESIPIDINIMRPSLTSENKEILSQKAIFNAQEYLDSFSNSFLCSIKKSAEDPNSMTANAALFFSSVYENLIAKNYLAINSIYFYLSYLPESVIMLVYGIFWIFIWILLYFFNVCMSIFYHIVHIPQFFRYASDKEDKSGKWQSNEDIGFFNMKMVFFCCAWWWIAMISSFFSPLFFTFYGLISPLYATYEIKQINKKCSLYDFIKDTFTYKRFMFFVLATLSLISNGYTYLGNYALIGIIIAIIFAYFMGLYTNEIPEANLNGFVTKIKQKMKQASVMNIDPKNPQLVEICKKIPMDDTKMDEIIKNGHFRPLTNLKGGETNIEPQQPIQQPIQQSIQQPIQQSIQQMGGKRNNKKYNIKWT